MKNAAERARILESNLSLVMTKLSRFESALQRAHEGEQRIEPVSPQQLHRHQPSHQHQQQQQHVQIQHAQQVSKRQKRSPVNLKEIPDLTSNLAVSLMLYPVLQLNLSYCIAP
jgi:hypothetical protein